MRTSIREVSPDNRLLRRMDAVCFPYDDAPDWQLSRWWLLREGTRVVGYCGLEFHDGEAHLSRAGVLPPFRGRGHQKRMIRYRVRRAGGRPVVTYTDARNVASINSLVSCGFRAYTNPAFDDEEGFISWRLT